MAKFKVGIGQDSHQFEPKKSQKPLIIGGVKIKNHPGFLANSDGDIVLHAITNAISSITKKKILGKIADDLCKEGKTDSGIYLKIALSHLDPWEITHIAITIEGLKPKIAQHLSLIESNTARILNLHPGQVGITATTGEQLTKMGQGLGMQALAIVTVNQN